MRNVSTDLHEGNQPCVERQTDACAHAVFKATLEELLRKLLGELNHSI